MRTSNVPREECRFFKFIRQVRTIQLSTYLQPARKRKRLAILSPASIELTTRGVPRLSLLWDFNKGASRNMHISWTRSKRTLTIITPLSRRDSQRQSAFQSVIEVSFVKRKISALAEGRRGKLLIVLTAQRDVEGQVLEAVDGRIDPGCFRKIHYTMADPSE